MMGKPVSIPLYQYNVVSNVLAVEMSRGDYCRFQNIPIPEHDDPIAQGYLINLPGDEGTEVDDFVEWLPKEIFEQIFKNNNAQTDLTFSQALELLKKGARITRRGWETPDTWLFVHETEGDAESILEIIVTNLEGNHANWTPYYEDLFATDWAILG